MPPRNLITHPGRRTETAEYNSAALWKAIAIANHIFRNSSMAVSTLGINDDNSWLVRCEV
jgi:hypothetical protein